MRQKIKHLISLEEDLSEKEAKIVFVFAFFLIGFVGWIENII